MLMSDGPGSGEGLPQPPQETATQVKAPAASENLTPEQKFSITGLKDVNSPADLLNPLTAIFRDVDRQSRDDARRTVSEKASGLIDFYKDQRQLNIPGLKGRSAAQAQYGQQMRAWDAQDIGMFIDTLTSRGLISDEQRQQLRVNAGLKKSKP